MNNELLIQLLGEYKRLLVAENDYRESKKNMNLVENYDNREERDNRPTKAQLKRVGIMIREQTVQAEKEHDKNYYWRINK